MKKPKNPVHQIVSGEAELDDEIEDQAANILAMDEDSDDEIPYKHPSKLIDLENQYEDEDTDSETEALQEAFAKGILKPGMNVEVKPKKQYVNNVDAMLSKLVDLCHEGDWVESLVITSKPALMAPELKVQLDEAEKDPIVHDELKRESVFYRQAQDAVLQAIPKLKELGIKTQRPDDYYAEMAKSDEHMQKVKANLIKQKAVTERVEKVRTIRQQKKLQKALQAQSKVAKQNAKKDLMDKVKKFRKGEIKDLSFLDKSSNPKKDKGNKRAEMRREYKDKKFGFGGKKRGLKQNTRDSTSDMDGGQSDGRVRRFQNKQTKGGKKQKKNRPGKEARKKFRPKN